MDWYARSLAECTPWSYVVLFGQIMLLSMLIERSVYLLFKASLDFDGYLLQVRKLVVAGNTERALKLAAALGHSPIGRVSRAGLTALGGGPFVLREALDQALVAELPQVHRRLLNILMIGGGLAVVGVAGSAQLGAQGLQFGGDGPLPMGLAIEYAPALLGVVSGVVGLVGWLALSRAAGRVVAGLEQCKQLLLDLGQQQDARH